MKIIHLAGLLLATSLLVSASIARATDTMVDGLWGGKWDNNWPVFIEIHAGNNPDEYKVTYRWLENQDDAEFSHQDRIGHKVGKHIEAGTLIFTLSEHGGLLYGGFDNPRMANLVHIVPATSKVEEISLESAGWTSGAMDADQALKKIKEMDGPQG